MNDFILRIMAWAKSRDRGASAVEYVLILAAIVGVIGLAVFAVGTRTDGLLSKACKELGTTC